MRQPRWAYVMGLVALLPAAAHAAVLELSEIEDVEALSLDELLERPVVAASRDSQKPGGSPTLVSTVDADQIDRLGLPGDYNSRIALSIDDHAVDDAAFQSAHSGLVLGLPMIAIDHMEMIRGGAWSLYGQSALPGTIQIVTASGATRSGLRVATTSRIEAETASDPAGRPTIAPRGQDVSAS